MNKINCNVIQDLLPLYVDDVVSDESRKLVEEHLEACPCCSYEAEKMKKRFIIPVNNEIQQAEANSLKKLKKLLRTRRFWTVVFTALIVAGLSFGVHCLLHIPQIYIPYNEELVQVQELENDTLRIQYSGETYDGFVGGGNIMVQNEDGTEELVTLVYYYHSPWTKYIEPLYTFDEHAVLTENRGWFNLEKFDGIPYDKIYYAAIPFSGPFRYHKHRLIEDSAYPEAYLESAILIYSRK